MSSPAARSVELLRRDNELVEVVERWNPHARVRHDLFGVIDILAVSSSGQVTAVQATSAANVSARRKKIAASAALPVLLGAGWKVQVHGWGKVRGRWTVRVVDLEAGDVCR